MEGCSPEMSAVVRRVLHTTPTPAGLWPRSGPPLLRFALIENRATHRNPRRDPRLDLLGGTQYEIATKDQKGQVIAGDDGAARLDDLERVS
jgi:hypothetical protein